MFASVSVSTMTWTPTATGLFDPARAAATGRGHATAADVLTAVPTLAWVELGDGLTDPAADPADPAAAITALAWADDAACAEGYHRPADPGGAIGRLIVDLGLRRVTRAAWNARVAVQHPLRGRTFQDPLYGVECAYTDGVLRLYTLDLTDHPAPVGLPGRGRRVHPPPMTTDRPPAGAGWTGRTGGGAGGGGVGAAGTGYVPWPGTGRQPHVLPDP